MIAARMGHVKTVQRLLELGADVNCKEKVSYLVEVVFFGQSLQSRPLAGKIHKHPL